MPTGTFHVTHYRDWASKRSYFKTFSSFHLDSSPISRALPVRNPISNTIWNLCRYPHQLLQRSLQALAMQAAKLYHPSLVPVQGHSGQQALLLLIGTPLVLPSQHSSNLFSHLHSCSAAVLCLWSIPAARSRSALPAASALLFSELTLESRGCEPASNILVKILLCLKKNQPGMFQD